jgi:3',5'-nucleoside bisphosphate phosphatase
MKKIFIFLMCCLWLTVNAQKEGRREIIIPNPPGYITLKCDFHMHTVFSDGEVWPTVRVYEAWNDGLDVIAITDHVEYSPHHDDIKSDRNRSYEIAKGLANQMNIILIHGAEITREYPVGHYNCLFINDAEPLNKEKPIDALSAVVSQSAVIQWNHPGWRQPSEIPVWYDFQQDLFNKKMMNVIEIINETSYYPLAHQWAIDKNLAISANSDIHSPVYMSFGNKIHRPITLVFAKERSEAGIKEALLAGRTAVYHFDTLMGKEEFLRPIFKQSLVVKTPVITIKGKQWIDVILENISDVPLMISCKGGSDEFVEVGSGLQVPAHGSARVTVKGKKEDFTGERSYTIPCIVDNYYISPRKGMNASFEFKVKFEKK